MAGDQPLNDQPIDIAFLASPATGGVWSVYSQLRGALRPHGLRLRWLGVGASAGEIAADPLFAPELEFGECVGGDGNGTSDGAAAVRHLFPGRYRAVVVNTLTGEEPMNIVRYLPPAVARVMIVHSITPATYAASASLRDYVHATVGVAPRVRDDLVGRFGFAPDRIAVIPNAIDLDPYRTLNRKPSPSLRLIFLGRMDEASKGVFWLPDVVRKLGGADWTLTLAGDGPALVELRRRFEGFGDRVKFLGRVTPADVPPTLARHDVFLMPSRFEACPVGMIEAMAAGCVPVASRIRGATDAIAEDARTGLLFPVGNTSAAAGHLRRLAQDPGLLAKMSAAAREAAWERYTIAKMGDAYAAVFKQVLANPPEVSPPLPLERWSYPRGFYPGLRRFVPGWAKNLARQWRA
jgi:glycosyltransferase involved in cell wall biosynthesis